MKTIKEPNAQLEKFSITKMPVSSGWIGDFVMRDVTTTFLAICAAATLLLMATSDASAIDAVYETVSATATVGLSRNLTATLNTFGKLIIIVTMYLGRVGPISLAVALGSKNESQNVISEPTEDISIG